MVFLLSSDATADFLRACTVHYVEEDKFFSVCRPSGITTNFFVKRRGQQNLKLIIYKPIIVMLLGKVRIITHITAMVLVSIEHNTLLIITGHYCLYVFVECILKV